MRNTVRIASGTYRGRKILTPGGLTHPMGEREKMALFNMISDYIPKAKVLDAYAGSGALGIEALGRGASSCVFVERSSEATRVIRQNLEELGISENIMVYKCGVMSFAPEELFDLIIADPPYDDFRVDEIEYLAQFLKSDGIFVLSHPDALAGIDGMSMIKNRQYARAHISVFLKY